MALLACSECGRQVSSKAAACPACGAPVAAPVLAGKQNGVGVTTQATGKDLKVHLVLSSMAFWFGLLSGFVTPLGFALAFIGMIWYFIARITRWWRHD